MSAKLLVDMVSEVRDLEREVRWKALWLQMLRATSECTRLKNRVEATAELLKRKRHRSSAANGGEPVDANEFDEADDAEFAWNSDNDDDAADGSGVADDGGRPLAYDGTDTEGCTNVPAVQALQADFRAFCGLRNDEEPGGRALYKRWRKARKAAHEPDICSVSLDSRLSMEHQSRTWGLTEEEALAGAKGLPAKARLQKLVSNDPTCLFDHAADDDRPWGEYFWPIDQAWMDDCDRADAWKRSLCEILSTRISGMMSADANHMITGLRLCPQPSGRYLSKTDLIRMWNATRGICKCGRHIWLGLDVANDAPHEDICDKENCSGMQSHLATVGRTDAATRSRHIHLHRSVMPRMICQACNGSEGLVRQRDGTWIRTR